MSSTIQNTIGSMPAGQWPASTGHVSFAAMGTADPRPTRTRIGAYAILTRPGQILLARLAPGVSGAGKWTLPGGGIEFGESPEAAAVREVFEETGLHVRLGKLLTINSVLIEKESSRHHGLRIIYSAEAVGGTLCDEIKGSTDHCEWIDLSDAEKLPLTDLASEGLKLVSEPGR